MNFFNNYKFPWSNMHGLNLDWVLSTVKSLVSEFESLVEYVNTIWASTIFGNAITAYTALYEGLKGDGVTDDSQALTDLILKINGEKATIIFGVGLYYLNANVTIPSNITLKFMHGAVFKTSIVASIIGDGAIISTDNVQIFDFGLGGGITGDWNIKYFIPQWFGAIGDGVTDDTIAIQTTLDTGLDVYFPNGNYAVSSVRFNEYATYYGVMTFTGIATISTDAVVELTGYRAQFADELIINQNFNSFYTSAMKWFSINGQNPAQYIKISRMAIFNAIIGILFGDLDGESVFDAPQSENSILQLHTRGVEIPIYMNQPNGFLYIGESTIASSKNEWDINNPGIYDFNTARAVKIYEGSLSISNSEVLKADTQLGIGIEINGGSVKFSNVNFEIASQNFDINDGDVFVVNSNAYFSNSSDAFIDIASDAVGKLFIDNFEMLKAIGAINADTAFIEHNGNNEYEIITSNVALDNQLATSPFKWGSQYTIPYKCLISNLSVNDGSVARLSYQMNNNEKENDFLLGKSVNKYCDDLTGWYLLTLYGGGTTMLNVVDAPVLGGGKPSPLTQCIELHATGEAFASTMDTTDLASIMATGLRVRENNLVLVSGWVKAPVQGSSYKFVLITSDSTGVTIDFDSIAIETGLSDTEWRYFEVVKKMLSAYDYVGVGVRGGTSDVRVTGVSLKVIK